VQGIYTASFFAQVIDSEFGMQFLSRCNLIDEPMGVVLNVAYRQPPVAIFLRRKPRPALIQRADLDLRPK
jgi:hypothetical protein